MKIRSAALGALSLAACAGCSVPRQMLAATDDFADYRAFRVATREGTRLARADRYLRQHPRGVWADEVRGVFETEERAWFERAQTSRSRARDYIVDLPRGPHADAARSLLALFDEHESDMDMLELLAQARHTAAMLDLESDRRRRVGDVVLEELAALLDPEIWGADLDQPPHALAVALRGAVPHTWGSPPRGARDDEVFFVLPTPRESEGRVAQVRMRVLVENGRIIGGTIGGEDLFVRWSEANKIRILDPTSAGDRAAAASDVVDILAGALEARFPVSRCATDARDGELLVRACDGWRVSVRTRAAPGAGGRESDDVIAVVGPAWSPRPP
jgi:hypothetical protein